MKLLHDRFEVLGELGRGAQAVTRAKRWTEAEAIDDARQLLKALEYLHCLSPPVIHQDIKP